MTTKDLIEQLQKTIVDLQQLPQDLPLHYSVTEGQFGDCYQKLYGLDIRVRVDEEEDEREELSPCVLVNIDIEIEPDIEIQKLTNAFGSLIQRE